MVVFVAWMIVRMNVGLITMRMGVDVNQVIFLQKSYVRHDLGGRAASYYFFIPAKNIHNIRYLFNDVHVMRRRNYCSPFTMISVQKGNKIS